ncbi:YdbL family protein [Gallaecimonas sp. GXIMD4217]|uniref:YdbL family protein n=1 Tax=Gallaecimonas sp. GXIMD4217 TaxID=3131927 RepID=UPI00311B00B5
MKHWSKMLALLPLLICAQAFALGLGEAKSQGLVGEQPDGYLGIVQSSPQVVALVQDINAKRRQAYIEIARKNGVSLEQVAKLAGQKAIARAPRGQFIRDKSGRWVKK